LGSASEPTRSWKLLPSMFHFIEDSLSIFLFLAYIMYCTVVLIGTGSENLRKMKFTEIKETTQYILETNSTYDLLLVLWIRVETFVYGV